MKRISSGQIIQNLSDMFFISKLRSFVLRALGISKIWSDLTVIIDNQRRQRDVLLKQRDVLLKQRDMLLKQRDMLLKQLKIEAMLSELYDAGILPKKECPVCGKQTEVFLPYVSDLIEKNIPDWVCPHCRSHPRHRCHWPILKRWFESINPGVTVKLLHFAPEKGLRANIEKYLFVDYWPVDIDPKRDVREIVDITDIPFKENDFDFIICNHVLEHVLNDKSGMSELYRVLKPGGKAMINVPIKMDMKETLQDERYNTGELRKRYYGQSDHVRQYGADFVDKLKDSGFKVTVLKPNEDKPDSVLKKYGLQRNEVVFICEK